MHKAGRWYLSVTYDVAEKFLSRRRGAEAAAFDWGIDKLLTIAKADGTLETIDNPRWPKSRLDAIKTLQRGISAEETKAKARLGLAADEPLKKGQRLPVTAKLKRLYAQLQALHGKIARQWHDFYHKLSAKLVERFTFLGTEELEVKNMSRAPKAKQNPETGTYLPNGAAAKAGLNRGILDAAPSMLLGMLGYKAEEAGNRFVKANTRKVKPTLRCHRCGAIVKKDLSDRVHRCACGCECDRDANAAKTLLRWLLEGDFWLGTGQVTQAVTASGSPETPPIAAPAV